MTVKPVDPRLVLLSAIVLPGSGQVINREPWRGLMFVFFILLLGGFTLKTAAADVSVVGKLAGGLFVWAMAILDAYKRARIRAELWRYRASAPGG
jgi:urea transporter